MTGCILATAAGAIAFARVPAQGGQGASKGVRCPDGFAAEYDAAQKILRCRKDIVRWVVTGCPDKAFASYVVKEGADACAPTEIPGVGTPPGVRGTKPVACAAQGFQMMTDRTGQRDRCEKTETVFALPSPAN
jgi:hypothetical protein